MSSAALPKGELAQLIDTLIDNHHIKSILMKSLSVRSNENNTSLISAPIIEQ
jgi:hypothetical protein